MAKLPRKKHKIDISAILHKLDVAPSLLLNVGVGQKPHNEAEQFKEWFPDIEIIGFEPQIITFVQRVDDYQGRLYPFGLHKADQLLSLLLTKDQGNTSLLEPKKRLKVVGDGVQLAPFYTLDTFARVVPISRKSFLWMDIEGSELNVLKGGVRTLRSGCIKWVLVEVSKLPRRCGEPSEKSLSSVLSLYGFSKWFEFDETKEFKNVIFKLGG